jgi:hypothetical protein
MRMEKRMLLTVSSLHTKTKQKPKKTFLAVYNKKEYFHNKNAGIPDWALHCTMCTCPISMD